VVEKGSYVDPEATSLEDLIDALNVFNKIMGSVNEEAGDHAVPLLLLVPIHFNELPSHHAEVIA